MASKDPVTQREHELMIDLSVAQAGRLADQASLLGHPGSSRLGMRVLMKVVPDDRAHREVGVADEPQVAIEKVRSILGSIGREVTENLPVTNPPQLWGVVGVGMGRLTPAVVRVSASAEAGSTRLTVYGVAKGRKCGQAAVDRVVEALNTRLT